MSIENIRNEFRDWALLTVQHNTTVDGYIESLDNDLPLYLDRESIFNIEDINEISALHSRCGTNGDLYEFSRNIGNGRPQAALGKYKKFLQYSFILQSMRKYENSPQYFNLNGAHWYFKVFDNDKKYPIKAICKDSLSNLDLEDNFTTSQAKSFLKGIFPSNKIDFFDINNIQEIIGNEFVEEHNSYLDIKNIILYGSPGVGKTHNIKKLISLIESGKSEKEIFETIKNNELNDVSHIDDIKDRMKFITFHQSFGYEDFIEGFRPNEEGNIELIDGIFKSICTDAEKNLQDSKKNVSSLQREYTLQDKLKAFVESCLEKEVNLTNEVFISNIDDKAFYYSSKSGGMKNQRIYFNDILECALNDVTSLQDIRKLVNISGTSRQRPTYLNKLYQLFKNFTPLNVSNTPSNIKVERQNYYLVIDEINRGNISKIFGELITLIEEDKRDTLEVTLPYSKKPFIIPSNLYIIGTMNSTDKSIALIDIALRRRFTFLKMEPNLDLVKNDKAKSIMNALNEKITDTLGADYVLGHSYFMKIVNDDDMKFVLEYKIKPLLEEYFYGDESGFNVVLKIIDDIMEI